MSKAARFIRLCAIGATLCFAALAVLSKVWIEPAGLAIFDSRFGGYSPSDVQEFLAAVTPAQIHNYLGPFRWLDTVFPLLLTVTLMGVIWLNARNVHVILRAFAVLGPLAYLNMDLSENTLVAQMLQNAPQVSDSMALRASGYTQAKWICLAVSGVLVLWAWRFTPKGDAA